MSGILPSDAHSSARYQRTGPAAVELHWHGAIQHQTTDFLMRWMESRLDQIGAQSLQKKRMIRVAVELLQNMHHHAVPNASLPRFTVYSTESETWRIEPSNAINPTHVIALQKAWETLKSKCKNELRAMQREKLAGESRSDHGGGGVGLNEILRKAAGRVEMNIENKAEVTQVTFSAEIPLKS
ncbi:MAG: DUF6272 family protein [Flavobacteriales bacterium]